MVRKLKLKEIHLWFSIEKIKKMALNLILCLNGQIGADVLFLVVKVLKLARGLAKEIIVAKISMKVKTVTNLIVWILGRAGVNVPFRVVKVLNDAHEPVKAIIAAKICIKVKTVTNLIV